MASRRKMESVGDYYYDKKEILGHGAFAIVFKGWKKQDTSVPVAVKCIAKKELSKSKELLAKEIKVLRELSIYQHENVVALLDVKETDSSVFLMIEYCNGGDLAEYLHSKGTLSEDTLSSFMQQIASALNALHEKGIMHRDMKPQNILICHGKGGNKLTTPPTQLQLKIADFGFARFLEDGKMAGTLCGSPMYMAPEVIMSNKYHFKADLWSVGTIIFQCFTGKAPFVANTPQQLRAFYEKNVDLKPRIPEQSSPELRDMLLRLLTRDFEKRIGIKELMQHPFLRKFHRSSGSRDSTSSPIPTRRRTPSLSSEGSTPGSTRAASPLVREVRDPDKDMASTLTGSNDDDAGFTKVEKPDTRPHTPEDFVLVPEGLPEYSGSGEKRGKNVRAPLAEEEYDNFDESVHTSMRPVKLNAEDGKVTFRRDDKQRLSSPTHPQSPRIHSPSSPAPSPPPSQRSGGSSAPIPVPSLSRMSSLSQQLQRDSTSSRTGSPGRSKKRSASSGSGDKEGDRSVARRNSETALAPPDITQVSPPAVQFSIGTPPSMGMWKRTSSFGSCPTTVRLDPSVTTPVPITSPLRRSASCSPGSCCGPHSCGAPSSLPTVAGSPTRCCQPYHHHHHLPHHLSQDPYTTLDPKFHRYPTMPDCTAYIACSGREEVEACHWCGTEPDMRSQPFHSHHILRNAHASHQQSAACGLGALTPWAGSRERLTSVGCDKDRGSPSSLEHERAIPAAQRCLEQSPPSSMMFAASPTNMESPRPHFVVPELSEDTLMDDEHNQTMAKLSFILDVVEAVVNLARSKGAACNPMADSLSTKRVDNLPPAQVPRFSESQRILEQLVLYLRALQMMSQSITLAEVEIKAERLQYVNSLKNVLRTQSELYVECIDECRRLYQQLGAVCKTPLTTQLVVNTADKLIYNYAVEQCQAAALDELAGNTKESFGRYSTAQILLHSLAQLANNDHDKLLLEKYRRSVELRLHTVAVPNKIPLHCDACS
ncbi:serine/threonine-protein kinase unc-51-like [Littorina saxatilis]|uniref:serine/threonine-protein kinase unc-51-like n=1 Tax=Littorina saxatilis TaxID=31220 RepID=UPI0038B4A497